MNNSLLRTKISSTKPFPRVIDGSDAAVENGNIRGSSSVTADDGPAASKSEKDSGTGSEKTGVKWSVGKAAIHLETI